MNEDTQESHTPTALQEAAIEACLTAVGKLAEHAALQAGLSSGNHGNVVADGTAALAFAQAAEAITKLPAPNITATTEIDYATVTQEVVRRIEDAQRRNTWGYGK